MVAIRFVDWPLVCDEQLEKSVCSSTTMATGFPSPLPTGRSGCSTGQLGTKQLCQLKLTIFRSYTQYIPLSIYDLQSWMGSPSIYV